MRKFTSLLCLLLCFTAALNAQSITIAGRVTDAKDASSLSGVTVRTKDSKVGVKTDISGRFSITIPSGKEALFFSFVGYQTKQITVTGSTATLNVQLVVADNALNEVVVVGYGTQKKANLTSSQTKVGGEQLANVPFSSVDQTLQGKVAGLQSITTSGQPGANQDVRIRGIGSISASAQPLYVVDGVQINSGDLSRNTTTSNTLAGLNPDDIERIDVLKDAAATAIYGSRAANGVILITTKKGKAGKTQIQFSTEIGQNKFTNAPDNSKPLRAADWLMLGREGMVNAGIAPATVTSTIHTYGDTSNIDTDWFGLLTRTGTQQQANLSASGGDEKTTFYVSGGYFNQESSVIGSNLKRYNGLVKITHKPTKNLLFDFSIASSYQNENATLPRTSFSNPVMDIYFLRPTQNPFNADGSLNISRTSVLAFSGGITHNPLYTLTHNIYNLKTTQIKPNLYTELTLLKGLKASTRIGIDYNNIEEFSYYNPNNGDGLSTNGYGAALYTRYFLYDWTNQLSYHANFLNGDLSADVKVGYEAIYNNFYGINAVATGYSTDKLVDLVNASVYTSATNTGSDYRFGSGFSNATLSYKNKYNLLGSFRRDGSSRFGPTNKFGNFWSVGGSWNISEEDFMKKASFISLLKLRSSYGLSGNAEIGNYTATALQNSNYNYNGGAGTAYETVGNESLKWEVSKQTDIGLELGLFNDKLNFVVDWYKKVNNGLLYATPISLTTGFASKTANIGGMQNQGIEVTINATPVQTKNFRWDVSFNYTHNVNKLTALPNNNADIVSTVFTAQYRLRVGQDYRSFYTYQWAGVDPANGDPLWFTDSSKSATTNDYTKASRAYLGKSASPKGFGGFSNTIVYKGFGLTADINYTFGNYVYDSYGSFFTDGLTALTYNKYRSNLRRWTTPGQITDVPKYVYNSTNKSNSASTRYLYQGDYVRLRNLEIFYNAPKSLLSKAKITSLRFYVRGSNLYSWIKDKNLPFDPEQGVNGTALLPVFLTKSMTAGLVLGF